MLAELQSCKTFRSVADLLGIPAKNLGYILHQVPEAQKYHSFCISKKGGKTRQIDAPSAQLKAVQRSLSKILYECAAEIRRKHQGKSASFGFKIGQNIIENAQRHVKRRWVFNIDLSDYFGHINFGRIYQFFIKNEDFKLDPKVAAIIAQIACYQDKLPQGAPCSPIISELVSSFLDYRLARLASKHRCSYSRYADDITFATSEKQFPADIAVPDPASPQGWQCAPALLDRIEKSGFVVNPSKTRMSSRDSRQVVTGLTVNRFPNVQEGYYKLARAMCNRLITTGNFDPKEFCIDYADNCSTPNASIPKLKNKMSVLEGRLNFAYFVRNKVDPRDDLTKVIKPTRTFRTYQRFLFYKYFVANQKPLLITEGKTDITYLMSAIKASKKDIPFVVNFKPADENEKLIDFFKSPKAVSSVLGIKGGTGNIGTFLILYKKLIKKSPDNINLNPVILLFDSDRGIKQILSIINENFRVSIKIDDDDDFYRIQHNLYVVKTPVRKGKESNIESSFPPSVTSQLIDGKLISFAENYDPSTHIGKSRFARFVYEERQNLDLSGIEKILQRIGRAIEDSL